MAKILVVDDVLAERVNCAAILRKAGHDVIEAENGLNGFLMAVEHQPDAIIMDIVMPEMDGFSAARRLMKDPSTKHIPVLFVSSKTQISDKWRAGMVGAKGYLVKPVEAASMLALIDEIT
jgi:twitching motility two-component system response regulator PilH